MSEPKPHTTLPAFTPVPRLKERSNGWKPEVQRAFIEALADTGSVASACRRVDRSTHGAYHLRRQPGAEEFAAAWQAALDLGMQRVEDVAMDRALNGVEVPHYCNGELIGTSRKYDERLTLSLLAMRRELVRKPKYDFLPEAAFETGDLAALADRVEQGPEEWRSNADAECKARKKAKKADGK